jgi:chromate reductase, NAD(P)H dehydrogenase (quinone)
MVFLNVPLLQAPEAYISGADKLFDAQGQLVNDTSREFLKKFITAYARWVRTNAPS